MTVRDAPPSAALETALAEALQGRPRALHALLARGSRLPGTRPNLDLAERFAAACAARGRPADAVVVALATLHADSAPGGTELEFLPLCGVVAAGARAAADPLARGEMLGVLFHASDDLRFRVRDAVPGALARIGAVAGEALLGELGEWMEGLFPAAAVLLALARTEWLSRLDAPDAALGRVEQAFELAAGARRSAERYPGYKALLVALGTTPASLAARFGDPVFELLARFSHEKEPAIREAIERNLGDARVSRRFAPGVERVRRSLAESAPVPRDPRWDVGPTRRRGGKRR